MKGLLTRLKLIETMSTSLRISRDEFVHRLQNITDEGSTGIFSNPFEIFSSSKNEFKGKISFDGFKLKKRKRLFDTNMNMAVAKGIISEYNGKLIIDTEIKGLYNVFIPFYVFLIVFYSLLIFATSKNHAKFPAIAFLLLHGTLMFTIPYFIIRRSVQRFKHELEREFFYLTKNEQ